MQFHTYLEPSAEIIQNIKNSDYIFGAIGFYGFITKVLPLTDEEESLLWVLNANFVDDSYSSISNTISLCNDFLYFQGKQYNINSDTEEDQKVFREVLEYLENGLNLLDRIKNDLYKKEIIRNFFITHFPAHKVVINAVYNINAEYYEDDDRLFKNLLASCHETFLYLLENKYEVLEDLFLKYLNDYYQAIERPVQGIIRRLRMPKQSHKEVNSLNVIKINNLDDFYTFVGSGVDMYLHKPDFEKYEYHLVKPVKVMYSDEYILVKSLTPEHYSKLIKDLEWGKNQILQDEALQLFSSNFEHKLPSPETVETLFAERLKTINVEQFPHSYILNEGINRLVYFEWFLEKFYEYLKSFPKANNILVDVVEDKIDKGYDLEVLKNFISYLKENKSYFEFLYLEQNFTRDEFENFIYTHLINSYIRQNTDLLNRIIVRTELKSKYEYPNFSVLNYSNLGICLRSPAAYHVYMWHKLSETDLDFVKQLNTLNEYVKFYWKWFFLIYTRVIFVVSDKYSARALEKYDNRGPFKDISFILDSLSLDRKRKLIITLDKNKMNFTNYKLNEIIDFLYYAKTTKKSFVKLINDLEMKYVALLEKS